jgi:hypothetical protein
LGHLKEILAEGMLPVLNKGHTEVSIIVDLYLDLVELLKLSVDLLKRGLSAGAGDYFLFLSANKIYPVLSILAKIACQYSESWIKRFQTFSIDILFIYAC